MASTSTSKTYPQHLLNVQYGHEHILQTVDICLPRPLSESDPDETVWLIFLHGGAWRDPAQTSTELQPALALLLQPSSPSVHLHRIAGFASVNYCLSPTSEQDEVGKERNGKHPEHIRDVLAALSWLRTQYGVGKPQDDHRSDNVGGPNNASDKTYDYILVGHSCGATLAFQVAMSRTWSGPTSCPSVSPPIAIVGLSGLYDLPLLHKNHIDQPTYASFLRGAFGDAEEVWRAASPSTGDYERTWPEGQLVLLGQSPEDELVEWAQTNNMGWTLGQHGWSSPFQLKAVRGHRGVEEVESLVSWGKSNVVVTYQQSRKEKRELGLLRLEGRHDEVWSEGFGLVSAIETALGRLFTQF